MKQIPLTQGKFALVDDEDFEFLMQWKWHFERGYSCNKSEKKIYMHNLINKTPTKMQTDHIDGNKLNNTKENLRTCSASQNSMNSKKIILKTSKYKGVYFFKRDKNWAAKIMLDRKSIFLGHFSLEIDAAKAYNDAAIKYFGKFARLNDLRKVA